ncbi:MAG TPA: hydroxyisourate hydrolase [Chitinophagales bacterium]|nr:hydroxyisourate hydrolase [Chitinophagales bacterium]
MKKYLLTLVLALITTMSFAQKNEFQLSSHILDISKGMPASEVTIQLNQYNEKDKTWSLIDEKVTDKNGRVPDFLPSKNSNIGIYKLTFLTEDYFKKCKTDSFYPFIEVVFEIKDENHYHVPITLSAYGYSTYRGN